MDLLIEFLDFATIIFGESVAKFFDKRIKSKKIKVLLSVIAMLIGIACIVGIIILVAVVLFNVFK